MTLARLNSIALLQDAKNNLLRRVGHIRKVHLLRRDEDVKGARHDEADSDDDHDDMGNSERKDVSRIVPLGVELGVRKREDDGEDGARDVFDDGAPDDWDLPVFAIGNDVVKIAAQLVALERC